MSIVHYTSNPNSVGVRIEGLDLSGPLSAATTLEIRRLLHEYKLVIFEQQMLDDEQLCAFAHRFGPPFVSAKDNPVLGGAGQLPDVIVVGNRADEYDKAFLGHQEVLPHSDHQWLRCPSAASLLYAIDIAAGASSTTWTNMAAVYAMLDAETRARIDRLQLITYNPFYRPFGSVRSRYVDSRVEQIPGDVFPHPLVRTHPVTGERVLYLHAAYEMELANIDFDEGRSLIADLHAHMMEVNCTYEHIWKNGDLVMWDNQATVHYRPAFQSQVRRVLKRVTIGGSIPF